MAADGNSAAEGAEALHTRWALWFHGTKNNNWGRDSYAILGVVRTVGDVAALRSFFVPPAEEEGPEAGGGDRMLFFMREATDAATGKTRLVYPIWEDPANAAGGTVCVSGGIGEMRGVFWGLVVLAAGEALLADAEGAGALVNGVSVGARKDGQSATVKVWYRSCPRDGADGGAGGTPAERAQHAIRTWSERARSLVSGHGAYFVPYRKVKQKDTRETEKNATAEYTKERRLQQSELSMRRQRRGRSKRRGGGGRGGRGGRRETRHHSQQQRGRRSQRGGRPGPRHSHGRARTAAKSPTPPASGQRWRRVEGTDTGRRGAW